MTIKNGNLNTKATSVTNSCIDGYSGGTINLENVIYTTNGSGVYLQGEKATANITNTTINSQGYCVTTNAGNKDNYGVVYNLKGSTFNGGNGEHGAGIAILVNVPGTYTIDGDVILGNDKCTINGEKGTLPKPVEQEKPTQAETPEITTK